MKSAQSKPMDLDLEIFRNFLIQCNRITTNVLLTEQCTALKRLCTASRYYDMLESSKMSVDGRKSIFVEFNQDVYGCILDDTLHLLKVHSNDVPQIRSEWVSQYGFTDCTDCIMMNGRGRRRRQNDENEPEDGLFEFYQNLQDRIHFFIFHSFDMGLREHSEVLHDGNDMNNVQNDEPGEGMMMDAIFGRERCQITSRRSVARFTMDHVQDVYNNFTTSISADGEAVTLRDALFKRLYSLQESMRQLNVHSFLLELLRNGFDSDAMELDLKNKGGSNLENIYQNLHVMEIISQFMDSINCMYPLLAFPSSTHDIFHLNIIVNSDCFVHNWREDNAFTCTQNT